MYCSVFLRNIRLINHHLASYEGNIIKRFTGVALRILLLEDHILNQDLQKKLDLIKQTITDNLRYIGDDEVMQYHLVNLRKATVKKFINQLFEFENSVVDEYIELLHSRLGIKQDQDE